MKQQGSKITDILALLVFTAFALCTLLVLLISAGSYQHLTDTTAARFDRRTALRYITTRVHQANAVEVASFEGCPALVLPEEADGETYLLRIYCYKGSLRELYCQDTAQLQPEDGEVILPADSLNLLLEGDLLTVDLGPDRLFLHIPSGTEVGS